MDDRKKAWLLLVATATLWSLGGLLIKSIEANPLAIAGVRGAIAAIIILAVLKKPQINWSFAQIGAALAYAATTILFVCANKTTTAVFFASENSSLLQNNFPRHQWGILCNKLP